MSAKGPEFEIGELIRKAVACGKILSVFKSDGHHRSAKGETSAFSKQGVSENLALVSRQDHFSSVSAELIRHYLRHVYLFVFFIGEYLVASRVAQRI